MPSSVAFTFLASRIVLTPHSSGFEDVSFRGTDGQGQLHEGPLVPQTCTIDCPIGGMTVPVCSDTRAHAEAHSVSCQIATVPLPQRSSMRHLHLYEPLSRPLHGLQSCLGVVQARRGEPPPSPRSRVNCKPGQGEAEAGVGMYRPRGVGYALRVAPYEICV